MADVDVRSKSLLKLHTREVEGRLGGHTWSKQWAAYLHLAVATRKREWWHDAYIVSVVRRSLDDEAFEAVIAWVTSDEDYHTIAARYRPRNPAWLGIQADKARRIAHSLNKTK